MESKATKSKCYSKGPFFGLVSIKDLNKTEEYEICMALTHRHNEAYSRLHGNGKCYENGTFERHADETSVEVCGRLVDLIRKDW